MRMPVTPRRPRAPERLSPQDATFIYAEGPFNPYSVASVMLFEEAPLEHQDVVEAMAARIHRVPRLRQKLAFVPADLGRPVWVDDPHFDIEYHVRHASLAPPGTEEQLLHLCSRLMEQHLDLSRPLWEMWLIDPVEGGRYAIFTKTHHCMIDGVSGADVTAALLDLEPNPAPEDIPAWTPRPQPSPARLAADALWEQVSRPAETAWAFQRLVLTPQRLLRSAADVTGGMVEMARALMHPVPRTPLNIPIGPNRIYEIARGTLPDFKRIKNALGGTVNDVALAAVTGGLRLWLEKHGALTEGLDLVAMVPVSTRQPHHRDTLGNRVAALAAHLPVWEADPVRRLELIRSDTAAAKRSKQARGAELIFELSGLGPPIVLKEVARLQNHQHIFNLVVTNVPGPQSPLYAAGHRLIELFPIGPIVGNLGLTVAVMSYAGRMGFGLIADPELMPDARIITEGIESSIAELLEAARQTEVRADASRTVRPRGPKGGHRVQRHRDAGARPARSA